MTAAGPVTAERWLYRERDDSQPCVSPVELHAAKGPMPRANARGRMRTTP